MTTQELRELDAWVAEHVMGWRRCPRAFDLGKDTFAVNLSDDSGGVYVGRGQHRMQKFHPTTDSAEALEVLKKCLEKFTVTIECGENQKGDWQAIVARLVNDNDAPHKTVEDYCVCAPTIELAIALFAKKMFIQTK